MRAFTFAHHSEAERVHHVAHVVFVALNPSHHGGFGGGSVGEVGDAFKHGDEFAHQFWGVFFPTLFHVFWSVFHRSLEVECGVGPKVFHEVDAVFHRAHCLGNVFVGELSHVNMLSEHWFEQFGKSRVVGSHQIFVVEPFCLFEVEFCATL